MPLDYVALKSEITADPAALGYAGKTDAQVAAILNTIGSGTAADGKSYVIFRNDIAAKEIVQAIESADFLSGTVLTQLLTSKLQILLSAVPIDATLPNVRASFVGLLSGASATTKTALSALAQRNGSRAEALFGTGTVVSESDIGKARNGQ